MAIGGRTCSAGALVRQGVRAASERSVALPDSAPGTWGYNSLQGPAFPSLSTRVRWELRV